MTKFVERPQVKQQLASVVVKMFPFFYRVHLVTREVQVLLENRYDNISDGDN